MSGLPKGWATSDFGMIADIKLGKMLDKAKNRGEMTPYLRNVNVRWGEFDLSDVLEMPMSSEERTSLRIRNGDILVCEGGEPGRCAVWNDGEQAFAFQKALMRVRPHSDIQAKYLSAFLRNHADAGLLADHFTGTTIKHLPQAALAKVSVPLPPLPEQRRIVAKIDSLTAKSKRARDHLDHIPRLVEKYKQAVLAAAFRGDLTREWRRRTSRKSAWRDMPLSTLVDEGPTNGWSPRSGIDATGALTLKLTATTSGAMRLDEAAVKRIYEVPPDTSPYWLKAGDILVQRANTIEYVGSTAIFDGPPKTYIYPDLMMRIRISDGTLRKFVWRFLNSTPARTYFKANATGTAGNMPKISGAVLKGLIVPFPPDPEERSEIVHRIETAFAWIDRLAAEATSASKLVDKLDQAVLAKAFRGELVPQDPSDEPASVLLDRIRAERAGAPKAKRGRRKSA